MKQLVILFALLVLTACKGDTGPAGPQGATGPQGAQGLPGPAGASGSTVLRYTVLVDVDGAAGVVLPAAVGSDIKKPPLVACYITEQGAFSWLFIPTDAGNWGWPYCGVGITNGRWVVLIVNGSPGWVAAFVVAY